MPTPYQTAGAGPSSGDGDTYQRKTQNQEEFDPEDHLDDDEALLEGPGAESMTTDSTMRADDDETLLDESDHMDGINYPTTQPTPGETGVRSQLVAGAGGVTSDPGPDAENCSGDLADITDSADDEEERPPEDDVIA